MKPQLVPEQDKRVTRERERESYEKEKGNQGLKEYAS